MRNLLIALALALPAVGSAQLVPSPTAERWQGQSNFAAMSSMARDVDMLMTTGPRC